MAAFTVHEPTALGATSSERAESLVFVRDGFSWRAMLFAPVYLLVRGEWLGLAAYAAAVLVATGVLTLIGAEADWLVWAILLIHVIAGFEASELKRLSLAGTGWQEIATVSGRNQEEAERRFFEAWLPSIPSDTPAVERHSVVGPWSSPHDDTTSRIEAAVRRLSERLRSKFATTKP